MQKNITDYIFENDVLNYESHLNGFTNSIYQSLDSKSKELNLESKIDDLLTGKIVNFSENQAAWHPKYRRKFDSIIPTKENKSKYKNVVTLGIGGSFEGPKLLIESLNNDNSDINHIFITGSDLNEFKDKLSNINPDETIFIVSSKSFITDETLETLKESIKWSGNMEKFTAITANKEEAAKYNIKEIIEFDKEIGGRYSIWSDIHLPALYCPKSNFDARKFLKGGHQADLDIQNNSDYLNFIKILSFSDIWFNNFDGKNTRAILSYSWKLRSFANYAQQLEMESLGKHPNQNSEYKNTGQIIFGGYGPTAQHSYFQLMHQGTQNICADIIASKEETKSLAYAQAITQAKLLSFGAEDLLKEEEKINGNIPTNLFLLNKIDSYTLGYLIATWEHRTFVSSVMLEINPFDQFGVSAGKTFTKKYIEDNGG
ncbi:hypothetical protein OAI73_00850 [Gammaproteobacteria bacterium]|nr:hypothetical protein [Gammaproteobacteria bacterium]